MNAQINHRTVFLRKIIKFLLILALVLPVLFFLNTNFSTDLQWITFQTTGFSVVFSLSLAWPTLRKYFSILSGFLLIFMAILFILGEKGWAEIFGSSAFGLALLLLISYLPQAVRRGYIYEE